MTELLLAADVKVLAPAVGLRGVAVDSAYIASVFAQIDGPVLAVGHSYGGAIISNAATGARSSDWCSCRRSRRRRARN